MKQTIKFSKNQKLNTLLSTIYDELMELGVEDVKRYKNAFPNETDFNIVQYGNLRIYYGNIRQLYSLESGYKSVKSWSNQKLWETYKRQVGYVVRNYF